MVHKAYLNIRIFIFVLQSLNTNFCSAWNDLLTYYASLDQWPQQTHGPRIADSLLISSGLQSNLLTLPGSVSPVGLSEEWGMNCKRRLFQRSLSTLKMGHEKLSSKFIKDDLQKAMKDASFTHNKRTIYPESELINVQYSRLSLSSQSCLWNSRTTAY